ncbi:MAG: ABC transporter ATP-binding protein [Holophaga sp.]|jgi:oligopeptide/dipeptide ABC transporter ATP-binding protein
MDGNSDRLLSVEDLHTHFFTQRGIVRAVNGVSFGVDRGRTLCLVGESGCGKSVAALSIMRLVTSPPGRIVSGRIRFEGRDLLALDAAEMRSLRGRRISMIFQEPMTSLNPMFRIGRQIGEMFTYHEGMKPKEARRRAIDLLALVGIPAPEKRIDDYPHHLSGGMRQRVMIAMALASPEPGLLIADEPTTALDVTIQAQILDLLRDLQQRMGVSILLITHNMGVVVEMADEVVVLYAGRKVEAARTKDLLTAPCHPYTRGLLNSIPGNPKYRGAERLESIPGTVPNLAALGDGCPFENRCPLAQRVCRERFPEEVAVSATHSAWCNFADTPSAPGR